MKRKWEILAVGGITFFLLFAASSTGKAQERIKVATPVKVSAAYFLPVLAAQEHGFWRDQGLEAEWLPFAGGTPMMHAIAAGAVSLGLDVGTSVIIMASRAPPLVIVADQGKALSWFLYVRGDSPLRSSKDLKGARFGVIRFGSLADGFTRAVANQLGIQKESKMIALGGIPEEIAALRRGVVDAIFTTAESLAGLEDQEVVRRLLALADYVPFEKDPLTVFVTRKLIEEKPGLVDKAVKVFLRSADFVMKNSAWAITTMQRERNWPQLAAKRIYEGFQLSSTGKIEPGNLEKIRQFLIDYRLVVKERTPPVSALYTNRFVGVR